MEPVPCVPPPEITITELFYTQLSSTQSPQPPVALQLHEQADNTTSAFLEHAGSHQGQAPQVLTISGTDKAISSGPASKKQKGLLGPKPHLNSGPATNYFKAMPHPELSPHFPKAKNDLYCQIPER